MKRELKILCGFVAVFIAAYTLPLGNPKVQEAIREAFRLVQWYARNHTLACVVPALFIAGAIITFLSGGSVMRYLGPNSNPLAAYAAASVAGCVLAVCSCSVLPIFAGIYRLGAGLGPASAFLYSGPGICPIQAVPKESCRASSFCARSSESGSVINKPSALFRCAIPSS